MNIILNHSYMSNDEPIKGTVSSLTPKFFKNRFIFENESRRIIQLQFETNKIKIDPLERALDMAGTHVCMMTSLDVTVILANHDLILKVCFFLFRC